MFEFLPLNTAISYRLETKPLVDGAIRLFEPHRNKGANSDETAYLDANASREALYPHQLVSDKLFVSAHTAVDSGWMRRVRWY